MAGRGRESGNRRFGKRRLFLNEFLWFSSIMLEGVGRFRIKKGPGIGRRAGLRGKHTGKGFHGFIRDRIGPFFPALPLLLFLS